MTRLLSFRYEGDRKNFNFDKYVNLHVEQHNQHADLQEYGFAPLAENHKTLWFQDGIRDPYLEADVRRHERMLSRNYKFVNGKTVRMSSLNLTINSWTSPIKGCFSCP